MAKEPSVGWTLGQLAVLLGGECDGPSELVIRRPLPAGQSDPHGLTFGETDPFLKKAVQGGAGAVLAKPGADTLGLPAIRVAHPRQAFGRLLALCDRPMQIEPGIHPTAIVSPDAELGLDVRIGPYAVIESGAQIGAEAQIFPFAYVGENCTIGRQSIVYPHAVLYKDVSIGDRVIIHAGAVLAADGFGFVWDGKKQHKVPQVGSVELGDEVEIGANTTVDRSTAGATKIGRGTKIDNQVMIAHNVSIGEDTVLAALCGISGSTTIGSRCTFGGQVATSGHVTVADDVILGGRSGVIKDIKAPGAYWGLPAKPHIEAVKIMALNQRAPEFVERIRELEKRLKALEDSLK